MHGPVFEHRVVVVVHVGDEFAFGLEVEFLGELSAPVAQKISK